MSGTRGGGENVVDDIIHNDLPFGRGEIMGVIRQQIPLNRNAQTLCFRFEFQSVLVRRQKIMPAMHEVQRAGDLGQVVAR